MQAACAQRFILLVLRGDFHVFCSVAHAGGWISETEAGVLRGDKRTQRRQVSHTTKPLRFFQALSYADSHNEFVNSGDAFGDHTARDASCTRLLRWFRLVSLSGYVSHRVFFSSYFPVPSVRALPLSLHFLGHSQMAKQAPSSLRSPSPSC